MITRSFEGESPATPATDVLLSEGNLREVLASLRQRLHVDVATVLHLDAASHHLVTICTDSAPRVAPVHHRVPVGRGLAGQVARLGTPIVVDNVAEGDLINPVLRALGVRSIMAVPIWHGRQLIGVLKVGTRAPRHFSQEEVALALQLGEDVNAALQLYFAADERAGAAALQRSLVPSQLPDIEGLDIAGRYVPGQGGVSGDWYDVFSLPGGRLGLVMGDVAGHGLAASVVMGRLRSALRAYSLEYDDPAEVLSHLDAKIVHFEPDAMATVIYAVTTSPFDEFCISSAGHLPPFVLAADGSNHNVDTAVGLPLGVDTAGERSSCSMRLEQDSTLILFTDGLIERRSRSTPRSQAVFGSISSALDELRRIVTPGRADDIASSILDAMLTIEPPMDDVALLVVRRTG